jgi:hypothetical protein
MKHKPLALAAAAMMAGFLSFDGAGAANVMSSGGAMPGIAKPQDANIQQASHRHWRRHHHGGSGISLGFGFGFPGFYRPYYEPYYYQPYYAQSYYYAPAYGSGHVRYCLNRYRTYDPRSDTFIGYDGYRHRCRSPYRY